MTQVHFTLKSEEIQSIIEYSVKDDVSKNILTTVFNQLMENQRTEYIQAKEYERTENRQSQRNGYYERSFTTRVGTLELKVPRTRDGHFSPTVFERYQRNEKALMASMLEMYVSGVSTRKVSKIVEELCGKSVSKSFVSSLTEQLEPMVNGKRQTMRLTLNETPLFYERRGFLHSSGSSDDQGIRSSNSAGSIFPCLSQRFGSSVRIYLK